MLFFPPPLLQPDRIVSPSLIQRELMIQHLQICTLCTVMTGNGFFSLTFSWRAWCDQSYPSNWISYETLPTNGREKARKCKKMGFICPLFTRWCLAVYLVLNFFYHQKKKKKSQTAYRFWEWKDQTQADCSLSWCRFSLAYNPQLIP